MLKGVSAISTLLKLIERMEDLVLGGMGVPLTPWSLVNADKLVPLLDRIRESLPSEIRQAQQIVNRREEYLMEAQRKAVQLLEEARIQAESLISESELMKAVHQEAERVRQEILNELEASRRKSLEEVEALKSSVLEDAHRVKEGADHYAETVLASLEKSLVEFQETVRNGQRYLREAKSTPRSGGLKGFAPPKRPAPLTTPLPKELMLQPVVTGKTLPPDMSDPASSALYRESVRDQVEV